MKQFAGVRVHLARRFHAGHRRLQGGFDLAPLSLPHRPGRAGLLAALVPPAGVHACWLAAVLGRADWPAAGAHVWEHGNLAQKNLTVIKVKRGTSFVLPFVMRGGRRSNDDWTIELARPSSLTHVTAGLLRRTAAPRPAPPDISDALEHGHLTSRRRQDHVLDAGDCEGLTDADLSSDNLDPFLRKDPGSPSRYGCRLDKSCSGFSCGVDPESRLGPLGRLT